MYQVVVLVSPSLKARFEGSIFSRTDFEVAHPQRLSVHDLIKNPPHMLVIHDDGLGNGRAFLDRLDKSYPSRKFPIIVINENSESPDSEDQSKAYFSKDLSVRDLNTAVARLLGLPTRRSKRHLVRLGVKVAGPGLDTGFLATVLTISGSGLLIEANRSLRPGHVHKVDFMGVRDFNHPDLEIRVLREEPPPRPGGKMRYFSAVFQGIGVEQMESALKHLID